VGGEPRGGRGAAEARCGGRCALRAAVQAVRGGDLGCRDRHRVHRASGARVGRHASAGDLEWSARERCGRSPSYKISTSRSSAWTNTCSTPSAPNSTSTTTRSKTPFARWPWGANNTCSQNHTSRPKSSLSSARSWPPLKSMASTPPIGGRKSRLDSRAPNPHSTRNCSVKLVDDVRLIRKAFRGVLPRSRCRTIRGGFGLTEVYPIPGKTVRRQSPVAYSIRFLLMATPRIVGLLEFHAISLGSTAVPPPPRA